MKSLILVASHADYLCEALAPPYKEFYRTTDTKIEGIKGPSLDYSEYAAFFSCFPLPEDVQMFGLFHYRCMLALDPSLFANVFPYSARKVFAENQVKFLDLYKDKLVIAHPLVFDSVWKQFCESHPTLVDTLILACKYFDSLYGYYDMMQSEKSLKLATHLYSRNLFVSTSDFALGWRNKAKLMVEYLDTIRPENPPDRWGGFILERLFSAHVSLLYKVIPHKIIQRPMVYFQ